MERGGGTVTEMSLVSHSYPLVSGTWVGGGRADPCLRACPGKRCQLGRKTEKMLHLQADPLDVLGPLSSSNGPGAQWRQMRETVNTKLLVILQLSLIVGLWRICVC